jgi:hypothetical protein
MRVAVFALCLAGAAALWIWALQPGASAERGSLPDEYCGEFRMHRFAQPQGGQVPDSFQVGQTVRLTFRRGGTYLYLALVDSGHEIDRVEGVASIDDDGRLVLRPMSKNRAPSEGPPQRYRPAWIDDREAGRLLTLTAIPDGYRLDLRPVENSGG